MNPPPMGERVLVYPKPGLRVQVEAITGRFLAAAGEEVTWSYWYHDRWRDGSVALSPWAPTPAPEADPKE